MASLGRKCLLPLISCFLAAFSVLAGINWKAVWLEKPGNPVVLEPGAVQEYVIMGLHGGNGTADLTHSPYLEITSRDPGVLEVDRPNARLIAKLTGQTELEISFSGAKSIVKVFVRRAKRGE